MTEHELEQENFKNQMLDVIDMVVHLDDIDDAVLVDGLAYLGTALKWLTEELQSRIGTPRVPVPSPTDDPNIPF